MSRNGPILLMLCGCALLGCGAPPQEINSGPPRRIIVSVAAAANLKFAFDELISEFHKRHPTIVVKPTYGASGAFYEQLKNNAPFDLFLSADNKYPSLLVKAGLASADGEFDYAVGKVVIWVRNESAIDLEKIGIQCLLDLQIKKISIANPKTAPYGLAAEEAMKKLGVYERVKDKIVQGENIAQASQYAESGAADVGIIALSIALSPNMKAKGRYWEIPQENYSPIEQSGVILSSAKKPGAEILRDFILSDEGQDVLKKYGFAPPPTK